MPNSVSSVNDAELQRVITLAITSERTRARGGSELSMDRIKGFVDGYLTCTAEHAEREETV